MGALVEYLDLTQRGKLPLLRRRCGKLSGGSMQIDAATRRNLELYGGIVGRARGVAAGGDRPDCDGGRGAVAGAAVGQSPSLRSWPMMRGRRLCGLGCGRQPARARDARPSAQVPDLDRALSRLALDRGGPRDMAAIRNAVEAAGAIARSLLAWMRRLLAELPTALAGHEGLRCAAGPRLWWQSRRCWRAMAGLSRRGTTRNSMTRAVAGRGAGGDRRGCRRRYAETRASRPEDQASTTCWDISSRRRTPTPTNAGRRRCPRRSSIARPRPIRCGFTTVELERVGDAHPECGRTGRSNMRSGHL